MILETMRDAMRTRLGVPENDSFYLSQPLDDLINEALQTISAEFDWPWLESSELINTVYGTRTYTPLDPNYATTKAVSIQGYDAMQYLDLQTVRNWPDDSFDVPMAYTIYRGQLYFAPSPSAVYSVRHDYIKSEPLLRDNTDTPLMPSLFHYSIIAAAVHLAHLRSGDIARASAAQQEYNAWLKRMSAHREKSTSSVQIRVRPGRDI